MKLPRPYISFSQINAYENNQFYNRYVIKKEVYKTKYLKYGKLFADAMEGKEVPKNIQKVSDIFKLKLPEGKAEKKLEAIYKYKDKKYNLMGYIDWYGDVIAEFKTGVTKWTQTKAENHGQGIFYQFMNLLIYGVKKDCIYYWIETKENENGTLYATGNIQEFKIPYEEKNIENIKKRINNYIEFVENYNPPKTLKL